MKKKEALLVGDSFGRSHIEGDPFVAGFAGASALAVDELGPRMS